MILLRTLMGCGRWVFEGHGWILAELTVLEGWAGQDDLGLSLDEAPIQR